MGNTVETQRNVFVGAVTPQSAHSSQFCHGFSDLITGSTVVQLQNCTNLCEIVRKRNCNQCIVANFSDSMIYRHKKLNHLSRHIKSLLKGITTFCSTTRHRDAKLPEFIILFASALKKMQCHNSLPIEPSNFLHKGGLTPTNTRDFRTNNIQLSSRLHRASSSAYTVHYASI